MMAWATYESDVPAMVNLRCDKFDGHCECGAGPVLGPQEGSLMCCSSTTPRAALCTRFKQDQMRKAVAKSSQRKKLLLFIAGELHVVHAAKHASREGTLGSVEGSAHLASAPMGLGSSGCGDISHQVRAAVSHPNEQRHHTIPPNENQGTSLSRGCCHGFREPWNNALRANHTQETCRSR